MESSEMGEFQKTLEQKEAELVQALQNRDGIAIEKSPDLMDEIQYASERDLVIRNVDSGSHLLRQVKAALRRIHDGSFGMCIDCEWAINPKRLRALPWASRCIRCQEVADRESPGETLVHAAGMSGSGPGIPLTVGIR